MIREGQECAALSYLADNPRTLVMTSISEGTLLSLSLPSPALVPSHRR